MLENEFPLTHGTLLVTT